MAAARGLGTAAGSCGQVTKIVDAIFMLSQRREERVYPRAYIQRVADDVGLSVLFVNWVRGPELRWRWRLAFWLRTQVCRVFGHQELLRRRQGPNGHEFHLQCRRCPLHIEQDRVYYNALDAMREAIEEGRDGVRGHDRQPVHEDGA